MPRISESSIERHVAKMQAALYGASVALFVERGIDDTSLGDVAEAIGLARNSLYRYVPDKDALVVQWIIAEMSPVLARSEEILNSDLAPAVRIRTWFLDQLEAVADPSHARAVRIVNSATSLKPATRELIGQAHRSVVVALSSAIASLKPRPTDEVEQLTALVVALVNGAFKLVSEGSEATAVAERTWPAVISLLDL